MARKKISIKEMRQTDEFVSTIGKISEFIGNNSKAFTVGVVVVVLLIVGAIVFNSVAGMYSVKSGEALYDALRSVEKGDDRALEKVREVADKYSFTRAGAIASYYEAEILFKSDKKEESLEKFRKIIDDEGDSLIGNTARLKLAGLASSNGNYEEAEKYLSEIVNGKSNNIPKDYAMFLMAQAQEKGGNLEKAESTCSELVESYPDGPYRQQAENKLVELAEKLSRSKTAKAPTDK